ncbi:acetyltransferase [Pelagibius sp. Alg239-R121]|uniref:acetyltransferase n=1 Tax=Pelagibius sp. Alg239-R121 TaxID=2993448 RepID=UPI0024A729A3|nr:acetyltransferase [Pelagibius sp. Alg239-R121]
MILFGVRSPLAVEYEEACRCAGITISACVSVNGAPRVFSMDKVVELTEFDNDPVDDSFVACAFYPPRREELTGLGLARGLELAEALSHPTAVTASSVRVGEGSFINAGVIIGAASMLGRGVLVNRAASLGHHTVLSDFVSVGPGATLAGNIHVGPGATIGAGAVILPDIRIGAAAVISAGSVVRRHVPEKTMVAGNPAVEHRYDPKRGSLNVEDGE